MLRNYLKIGVRNLLRNKVYSLINIIGLAVGVAAVVLLFSLVSFELSFDTFHAKANRIYRIVRQTTYQDGNVEHTAGTSLAMIDAIRLEIPQFESVVPACGTIGPQITVLGKDKNSTSNAVKFTEENQGICVGPEFFELFDFRWLVGSPKVLEQANMVVLSKKYAEKYFGNYQNAVGQYLRVNNNTIMMVGGVLENPPLNTDLQPHILFSYQNKRNSPQNWGFGDFKDWGSTSSMDNLFVLLPPNFTAEQANKLLATFTLKHWDTKKQNEKKTHSLSPLATMHFDDRYGNFSDRTVPKNKLWGIALVGFLIILMACINFINIATAIATKRAKEVGVRKTLGSANKQLIYQFMPETLVIVALSIVLGLLLAYFAFPLLTNLFDFPQEVQPFAEWKIWGFALLLLLFISVFSGVYPATVLSSFSPLEAFRQKVKNNWTKGFSLRQGLIVFQFTIALVMLVGTIVNFQQMKYISTMNLGFQKEGVYTFGLDTEYKTRYESFRNKLKQIPEVQAVSFSNDEPSSENNWQVNFAFDKAPKDADFNTDIKFVDAEYVNTYGLRVIAGEPYVATDTLRKFIVNQTLLKKLGVNDPASAVGKTIKVGGWDAHPITAVVEDFQVGTAHDQLKPLIMTSATKYFWKGSVKLRSNNLMATVAKIEQVYAEVFPEVVFGGSFYEESLNTYYKAEQQIGLLYRMASLLSILIACLGVFGLVTFVAEQRIKEIGIRKVLGASVASIMLLLSRDFIKLVFVSMLIAFPIAYYFMDKWLQDFAYRINLQWWVFALAGGLAVLVAMLTVAYQSVRAALLNPVKSLKTE